MVRLSGMSGRGPIGDENSDMGKDNEDVLKDLGDGEKAKNTGHLRSLDMQYAVV